MQRKKILTGVSEADAAANLRDDEEIVVSNVQTIRKNTRMPIEPPEIVVDDFPEAEIEDENGGFEDGTIGFLLTKDEDERLLSAQCNILVVRKPDSAGEKFLRPCVSRMSEAPIRNVDLTQSQVEIEELVRSHYGGGHYYLQIQMGNQIQTGWTCDLADSPEAVNKSRLENQSAAVAALPVAPVSAFSPMEQRIKELRLEREYDDLKFGAERAKLAQLEQELKELRDRPAPPEHRQSERITLLDFALKSGNEGLVERAMKSVLPDDEAESSHWLVDLVKVGFEHKAELAGIAQMLLGGLTPPPASPQALSDVLRMSPPIEPPSQIEPPRSNFKRKAVADKSESEVKENDGNK